MSTIRPPQENTGKFVRRLSQSGFEEVSKKLRSSAIDAVALLQLGLYDSSSSTRIRAAVAILSLWTDLEEIGDLESRVSILERRK